MDTFGYFNIGEYIGDPRQISSTSTSYPDLDTLRNEYFEKYTHNYNIWDYVRLIKYFDNSLFKMIRDWTPARTSLATGVVIKQHLLERNKYPVPQVEFTQSLLTASIDMYEVTASNAGGLNITSIVTQSWTGTHSSLSGSIPFTQNTEDEFFNGEFSGSFIEVTNGELNGEDNNTYPILEDNIDNNRLNPFLMDIDYSFSQTQAVNQQLILAGNATRFAVPESNYTMLRSVNPRYNGSRTTSPNFNQPIYKDLITLSTESQEPNASRYSNWFVYFDYIESSFPEVPGGGNIHCTYLINTEGQAIPLTGDNKYVQDVSNIFTPGLKANISPAVYADKQTPQITIFDGGTKYQTIIEKSGSGDLSSSNFDVSTNTLSLAPTGEVYFSSSAATSSVLLSQGNFFIYMVEGSVSGDPIAEYRGLGGIKIYDSLIEQMSETVKSQNSLFPLQELDIIRFGNSNNSLFNNQLDNIFNNGFLYYMTNLQGTSFFDPNFSGSFNPVPQAHSINKTNTNQTFRIFRRLEDETFVVSTSLPPYRDPGLLIPENFNPNFNPYELAKKAGVIS
jgi:hypothetical protein